jgi:hypothetical protein
MKSFDGSISYDDPVVRRAGRMETSAEASALSALQRRVVDG